MRYDRTPPLAVPAVATRCRLRRCLAFHSSAGDAVETHRRVTTGRLRRLAEELTEEELGVVERSSRPDVLVDEVDYALRPPRHERRVPSYGSFVLPVGPIEEWVGRTGLSVVTSRTTDVLDDVVRRYADGLSSWTVRSATGVDAMVVFDRPAGSERDLVVLAAASGAMIVQRHPSGDVRLVGSFGVARWDGLGWHVAPPVGDWLALASCGIDDHGSGLVERFLQFAVHDLGAAAIGTLLVYGLSDGERRAASIERRLPPPPPLNIARPADLAPLRHVLTQLDGAAVFDIDGTLVDLGVRLVPSAEAESVVQPLRGTRHTNGRRFSHDHPSAVVIAVSDEGPVTVFRNGTIIGESPTE